MASGPTVEVEGGGDGPGEFKRFVETNVYRRKSFKKKDAFVAPAPDTTDASVVAAVAGATVPSDAAPVVEAREPTKDNGDAREETLAELLLQKGVPEGLGDAREETLAELLLQKGVPEGLGDAREETLAELLLQKGVPEGLGDAREETLAELLLQKAVPEGLGDAREETLAELLLQKVVPGGLGDASRLGCPEGSEAAVPSLALADEAARVDAVVVSDDSLSLNRQQGDAVVVVDVDVDVDGDVPSRNGLVKQGLDGTVSVEPEELLARKEARELRRKLRGQLETVRSLVKKIEVKQVQVSVTNGGGAKRAHSEVTRGSNQLSVLVMENNSHGVGMVETVEKEKRTPKANQFYRNSEFLLAKDKFPPAESNKKPKSNGKKHGDHGMGSKFAKSCGSLLEKLMKHKHGWVFNEPVDAELLGLHDYHIIIKQPMDLGTIKSRLSKNWYKSPKEFAEDVRVTFMNAMTYNPKGQDVHVMAEQLATIFEERWAIIESDYNREMRFGMDYGIGYPTPTSRKAPPPLLAPPPLDMRRVLDRSESMPYSADPKRRPFTVTPTARTPAPKKPKAKDPHKRDMTFDEKQKLSTHLQGLPSEKLDAIVQIIKKRNSSLFQQDDEIEVDIDSVDTETLWELDRFVTNYKKSLSKNKRKAELAMQAQAQNLKNVQEQSQAQIEQEVPRENKTDENENVVSSSSPVQGNNQGETRSRSSSSSSSSSSGSSSSDSDSDSSSGSGSDDESPPRS